VFDKSIPASFRQISALPRQHSLTESDSAALALPCRAKNLLENPPKAIYQTLLEKTVQALGSFSCLGIASGRTSRVRGRPIGRPYIR